MKTLILFTLLFNTQAFAKDFLPGSFKADFSQEYKTSLKGKIKKSTGQIEYKYPSQIRFEVLAPDKVVFISNKKKSWYYQAPFIEGEPGELNIRKTGKNGLSRFFDILKKGLKTNKFYTVKNKSEKSELKFVKTVAKELDIKEAQLVFKSKKREFNNIKNVELVYLDGHKIKLSFKGVKTGVPLKKERFVFKTPKNTRVNQ
ncbi:MAG: outer membrane lipoprotein carrier protein LolA [Bacteriovoracaceae bacterium]|nr:outer membrane lipoprotein carrier protein LolA [Bacteriovoracaceae bacterium]